tara:strand:+ start:896 stop:1051 length:156 start_codon:yes stop_codon:yes gene_type:complete
MKNKRMYMVLSRDKNYLQGCFPFSEEGKKQALKYQKKIKKTKNLDTYLIEK